MTLGASLLIAVLSGLYDSAANVLRIRDFTGVLSSSGHTAIEFFAGWCGHCQAFAPTWHQVADYSCSAIPTLRIGAVDCVSDFLTCQEVGTTPIANPLACWCHVCNPCALVVVAPARVCIS